jgi:hypothetical protein
MDIKTINTPEKLHQAISEFLQSDYSHENLVETYNDALKCVARFRVDYLALPTLLRKDDPLYGLQDVMDWCIKASGVVDNIVFNLERQTIVAVINHLKKLRGFASRALSLVNSELREQAQKEARAKVEKEYQNLNEKAEKANEKTSEINYNKLSLVQQAEHIAEQNKVLGAIQWQEYEILRRETEDIVQIYLSKDPTFKDKLSQLRDEEINKAFEAFNKLVGSDTPTGKLLEIYCKLKDIPLQRQLNDVGYAYHLNDYTDMICGSCNRLYTSVDDVIKTFEEIQTKAEQKADLASTKKSQPAKKQYRKPVIIAAVITAVATVLAPVIIWFLNSHSNKQDVSIQKNVSTSLDVETRGNLSPAVVTSGPNSPVNIYLTPGQSETRSEVSDTDVNRPK